MASAQAAPDEGNAARQTAVAPSNVIVVTARKREESLQDVPLAVQAFTSDALEKADVSNLEELKNFTPGFDYTSQSGDQFAGRYLPSVRFRGLSSPSPLPSNQVGSLFVDGVFVLGGAQSIGFEDVERVEIIRGPQAAYFGRSTFAGAINYVTKDPAFEFGGKVSAEYMPRYGSYSMAGSIEGPILGETVAGRLTVSTLQNGAYRTATDGGRLGEETTDAIHASLLIRPSPSTRIKLRASYVEDEDTQPATTAIQFFNRSNCAAGTPLNVLDASGASRSVTLQGDYWCGALPEDVNVSANTTFVTFPDGGSPFLPEVNTRELFVGNSLDYASVDAAPFLDHFGLRRQTLRLSLAFDSELSDSLTLSGNASYNDQDLRQIADRDFTDLPSVFMGPPSFFEDYSGELRLSYDKGGPLRAMIGANYYNQKVAASFINAIEATNEISFDIVDPPFNFRVAGSQNSGNDDDRIETIGLFGSLEYDLTDWLTATVEGRWQKDEVTTYIGQFQTASDALSFTTKSFLPRVILTAKPTDDLTVYMSYSEGALPGQFNRNFLSLSAEDQGVVRQSVPNIEERIDAEKLTNYELGIKQSFMGGRARYSLALYKMDWDNMKADVSFFPPGATGLQGAFVPGSSDVKGLEFEGSVSVTDNFTLAATLNYTDAKYQDFTVAGVNALFGLTDLEGFRVDGNTLPNFPKWSGSAALTYEDTLSADWDWYARADASYRGKAFADESNINWISGYILANLRFGIRKSDMSIEVFGRNLTDETGWASGATGLDLGVVPVLFSNLFVRRAAIVTPLRGREFGVRASWEF